MASRMKYDDIVNGLAMRATEAQAKSNNDVFRDDRWLRGKDMDEWKKAEFKKFRAEIEKRFPFDRTTDTDLFNLENFQDDEARKWLKNTPGSYTPGQKAKSVEAAKFLPLLDGVAKPGESWYDAGSDWLREKGSELGYSTGTGEGFREFLDKVGEYQKEYDRAKNLKEFDEANGPLSYIMYPTLMNEARNAVMTGEGGDVIDADHPLMNRYGALDLGTNFGIALAPGANMIKSRPLLNSFVNSALQGGIEGARQVGTQAMSTTGQEGGIAPVLAAMAFGATRPAMVGTAQAAASHVQGYGPQQFARGISMATRKGDPVAMEREGIKRAVENFNNSKVPLRNYGDGVLRKSVEPSDWARVVDAQKAMKYAKELGVPVEDVKVVPTNEYEGAFQRLSGTDKRPYIDVDRLLAEYDRPFKFETITDRNGTRISPREPEWSGIKLPASRESVDGPRLLWEETHDAFRNSFPAKYDAALGDNAYRRAGLQFGRLVGDVGGSFEPALKVNPLDLMEPSKIESKVVSDYKETEWYKKLDDEQKAIVDRAYRKKANK